jgi:hypothetical protein
MVSSHERLLRLQKKIYAQLRRENLETLGPPPPAIRAYARRARRDLRAAPTPCEKPELIRAIRAADVAFIGDFHAFAQAQRSALRLMREAIRPGERWAIGLELVSSQHQRALDAFQAGQLSRRAFHRRIRYDETWGFPWAHYEAIFDWARERGVHLVARSTKRLLPL